MLKAQEALFSGVLSGFIAIIEETRALAELRQRLAAYILRVKPH